MTPLNFVQLMKQNTGWLYLGEILPRLASLVVVPIWSARVAPDEYARWVLALTSAELLLSIGGVGFADFLMKVLYRFHDDRAERYFGMGVRVVLGATAVVTAGMASGSPWLTRVILGPQVRSDLFAWLAGYVLLAQLTNLAILYHTSRVRYRPYFVLTTMRWVLNTGLLLFFLLAHRQGFYSWVWAWVGTELLLLPAVCYQLRHVQWGWQHPRMRAFAFRFSFPSLVTNFLHLGHSRIGRYVLSFTGANVGLGLYGVAESLARHYGAAIRPMKLVAQQIVGHAIEADAESPHYLEFFHGFSGFALSAAFLTALFLGDLMKLFVSSAYWGATAVLPTLVFTIYLQEVYNLYHPLMLRYFKVWFHFFTSLIAFPIVITATVLLVRPFGFPGAAAAQLVGAVATMLFAQWYAQRVSPRAFRFAEKMGCTAAAFLLTTAAERFTLSVPMKALLAIVTLGPYLAFHWWRRHELFPLAARMTSLGAVREAEVVTSQSS